MLFRSHLRGWMFAFILSVLMAWMQSATGELIAGNFREAVMLGRDFSLPSQAITTGPKYHWFSYYDVLQFDPTQRYVLSMEVDFEHRSPRPDDVIEIGMIDLQDNYRWTRLGESRAWCWQQGCRLQWRPGSNTEIIYNDRDGDHYVSRIYDIQTQQTRTLPYPVYHITPDGQSAVGLDFARLDDCRPGYGYEGVEDAYEKENAPDQSYIYRLNLETGEKTTLMSLADIAQIQYKGQNVPVKKWFNHLEWNPSGERFLFFFRGDGSMVYTADRDGKDIRFLASGSSHYTWRDDAHVLIWSGGYRLYRDDNTGDSELIWHAPNGHQTYLPDRNWVLTDTYPDRDNHREQHVYLYHIPTQRIVFLGHFTSPKEYTDEWRCDTHPRLSPDGTKVVIDSPHGGNGRQQYLIDLTPVFEAEKQGGYAKAIRLMDKNDIELPVIKTPALPGDSQVLAWLEAETAKTAKGLGVDVRKRATTSEGKCLGIHADEVAHAEGVWTCELEKSGQDVVLLLRYAAVKDSQWALTINGEYNGVIDLATTGGWGGAMQQWQWIKTPPLKGFKPGVNEINLQAVAKEPINLDVVAVVAQAPNAAREVALDVSQEMLTTETLTLPEVASASGRVVEAFSIDEKAWEHRGWGRGAGCGIFFEEKLPAFFERTVDFDELDADMNFRWIFTGPRGGIILNFQPGQVEFIQRFYDSVGLLGSDSLVNRDTRYAERVVEHKIIRYEGALRQITVIADHKLGVSIQLNGKNVLNTLLQTDLHRHQLWFLNNSPMVAGRLVCPPRQSARVKVNAARCHQTIVGFGGIGTPMAYAQLSEAGKRRWWEIICEYNMLVQREYPIGYRLHESMDNWDNLADASPHYYGDNFPNGEITDFDYNRKIQDLGGEVWFEFWQLPPWVGDNMEKYAAAMVHYCQTAKARTGRPPTVVGIQNEVRQSAQTFQTMTRALRRALDEAGFTEVKIHMSDSSTLSGGVQRAKAFTDEADVWTMIDYSAAHMYDYQNYFENPDGFDETMHQWKQQVGDKPFLSTEICVNSRTWQWPGYRLAFSMGQLYHKNMTLADAAAIIYCWSILNVEQPAFGWTRSLFVPDAAQGDMPVASSNQARVFGAFSRRLPKGMMRIDAETTNGDLLATAYQQQKDGYYTLIILNRSQVEQDVQIDWPEARFTEMELTSPYHSNTVTPAALPSNVITVQPGAIVTLTNVPLKRLSSDFKL